jgi:hypothetical protein
LRRLGLTLLLAPACGVSVDAQEYCVACVEPAAVYRCQIANNGPAQTHPLKLACISALAKDGKHASCSVKAVTVLDCDGPVKKVDVLGKPPAAGAAPSATEPYVIAAPKPPEPDPNAPPRTVEEALRRAAKSTGDSASQTSDTLSKGAKKTWDCVTSFFKSC